MDYPSRRIKASGGGDRGSGGGGGGGGGGSGRGANASGGDVAATAKVEPPKEGQTLVVDFGKLDVSALKRYKRHYKVRTKHNSTKSELVAAITKHFAGQPVLEVETITYFAYAVKNQDKVLKLKPPKEW